MTIRIIIAGFASAILASGSSSYADESAQPFAVPAATQQVFKNNCVSCHGPDTEEGDIRFDTLATLPVNARLDLLNKAQEQLFFGLMPPAEADQPAEADRKILLQWLNSQLTGKAAEALAEK
ncbi:MAG: c-type cytochrome domain-containing protein, partial [Planctomycetota bacterium]